MPSAKDYFELKGAEKKQIRPSICLNTGHKFVKVPETSLDHYQLELVPKEHKLIFY